LPQEQFHLSNASFFLVGRPLESFIGPGMPHILEQNDFCRLAAFEPFFNFDGFVVTAICSFEPGFSLR
jgi:hypothetical protein